MKIKNYFQFILEDKFELTVPLQFSKRFLEVLGNPESGIDSPIKDALIELRLSPQEISLIDIGSSPDTASFTTAQKISQHLMTDNQDEINRLVRPLYREDALIYNVNRTEIRIGRLIKKIFADRFSDSEIEKFVNQYKSILDQDAFDFEVWRGSDIKRGYSSINYTFTAPSGNSLMGSCMNDLLDQVDFYMGCPVSLLVLLNDSGQIFGRALLWEFEPKKYFLDRVYVAFERDYFKFINWAKKNNCWWKSQNKSGAEITYTNGKINEWFPINMKMSFDFEEYKEWKVPYLDTFCYVQGNRIMNYMPKSGSYYRLTAWDGTYDFFEDENEYSDYEIED